MQVNQAEKKYTESHVNVTSMVHVSTQKKHLFFFINDEHRREEILPFFLHSFFCCCLNIPNYYRCFNLHRSFCFELMVAQ